MIKSDKKINELDKLLKRDDKRVITEAIELLREEKPFEGAIGLLTAFFDRTDDIPIRKTIAGFMNDLKDQSVCQEVMKEIGKEWKSDTISMLVSSCWQSGLDYSEYSLELAKIFLTGDYMTALECFTVIEESASGLSRKKRDEIKKLLEKNDISESNEKTILTSELLAMLNR